MWTTVASAARRPAAVSSAIRERISAVSFQWFMPPPFGARQRYLLAGVGSSGGLRPGAATARDVLASAFLVFLSSRADVTRDCSEEPPAPASECYRPRRPPRHQPQPA